MEVIIKYVKNGIYTRKLLSFDRKGIKYYLNILLLKLTRTPYETIESDRIKKKRRVK